MTPNHIRARQSFSFKAETYELDARIDLDRYAGNEDAEPNFHQILAQAGGIDTYSYLYEVLESHEITFSEPSGVAVACCRDGHFDWPLFAQLRREAQDVQVIREIAQRTLGVDDLEQQPALKAALLAAYRAGRGG